MSIYYAKSIPRSVAEEVIKLSDELEAKTRARSGESDAKLKAIRYSVTSLHVSGRSSASLEHAPLFGSLRYRSLWKCARVPNSFQRIASFKLLTGIGGRSQARTADL